MEALKFNLLNPLVVKYWYFFLATSSGTLGTVATAKRFTRRWGSRHPIHPLFVGVRS